MGRNKQFKGDVEVKLMPMTRTGFVVYVNRTPEERLEIAKKICNLYSTGQYTLSAICEHVQVKIQSFLKWASPKINVADLMIKKEPIPKGCIPQVNQWYLEARQRHNSAFIATLDERAKVGLLAKIEGVDWEEVEELEEMNNETKEMEVVKRKTKKGRTAPDTAAIIFALTNTDPERFKNTNKFQVNNTQNNFTGLEGMSDEELQHKLQEKKIELIEIEQSGKKSELIDFIEENDATLGENEE